MIAISAEFMADAQAYSAALAAADGGDLKPLQDRMKLPFSEAGFACPSIHL